MIHDGMDENEIEQQFYDVQHYEWSHSITLGVAGDTASYGDVWMSLNKAIPKLLKADPSARYAFWTCKNVQDDGTEGRPHVHGIIRTELTVPQIRRNFFSYGGHSYKCKQFDEKNTLDGWLRYVLTQSVRGTLMTNITPEDY